MYILFVIVIAQIHPSVNWNIYILLIGGIVQVYHFLNLLFIITIQKLKSAIIIYNKGDNKNIKKGGLEFSANPPDGT